MVWMACSGARNAKQANPDAYMRLIAQAEKNQQAIVQIEKGVCATCVGK
jgi:hypothetical protein